MTTKTFLRHVEDVARLEGWSDDDEVDVVQIKLEGIACRFIEWMRICRVPIAPGNN